MDGVTWVLELVVQELGDSGKLKERNNDNKDYLFEIIKTYIQNTQKIS